MTQAAAVHGRVAELLDVRWSRHDGRRKDVYFFRHGNQNQCNGASSGKRRKYAETFKAEALRLAGESRRTQAMARQLGISPTLLYRWQQAQRVAEVGSQEVARDPAVRALRALLKELDTLKKPWLAPA